MVRHRRIHCGHACDVDDHELRAVGADSAEKLLGELARPERVDETDDGKDEQPLAHLQHGRRKLADGLLLLSDDALAFANESHGHGDRDGIRCRLVCVEHRVEESGIRVVLREQGAREHVAQQEHDADDLVGLNASRDDALGQILGVGLKGLERSGLERLDIAVVDGCRFREDLVLGHGREQPPLGDAPDPLLAQLRTVFPEMRDQLAEESGGRFGRGLRFGAQFCDPHELVTSFQGRNHAAPTDSIPHMGTIHPAEGACRGRSVWGAVASAPAGLGMFHSRG